MQLSIDPITRKTRDKDDKVVEEEIFLVRDGNAVVCTEKTRPAAEKAAREYSEVSGPLVTMLFTIESHTRRARDKDDKVIIEHGFMLRGDDMKFAKFSTDRDELVSIVRKSGGKMQDTAKEKVKVVKAKESKPKEVNSKSKGKK